MDAGLDIAVAMDNAANVAMNEALNSEWDNAKNAGHVEVCDPMAEEAVEAFCDTYGLMLPTLAPSEYDLKTRRDTPPMTQEPIE